MYVRDFAEKMVSKCTAPRLHKRNQVIEPLFEGLKRATVPLELINTDVYLYRALYPTQNENLVERNATTSLMEVGKIEESLRETEVGQRNAIPWLIHPHNVLLLLGLIENLHLTLLLLLSYTGYHLKVRTYSEYEQHTKSHPFSERAFVSLRHLHCHRIF